LRAEVLVVIDFAVEDDGDGVVFVEHGLVAAGEVNDGQAAMAEGNMRINEETGIVRAAMSEGVAHTDDGAAVNAVR
jgi:hypothetical protein